MTISALEQMDGADVKGGHILRVDAAMDVRLWEQHGGVLRLIAQLIVLKIWQIVQVALGN